VKSLKTLFNEHPCEVGLTYPQHFLYALSVTWRLAVCVAACFVHAFFPFLFTHKTSTVIKQLDDEFSHRIAQDYDGD